MSTLKRKLVWGAVWLSAIAPYAFAAGTARQEKPVSFVRQVQPILKARCVSCHGGSDPSGRLDLSSAVGIKAGGVVVAGKPEESLLLKRIHGIGGDRMPLDLPPLPEPDQKVIELWLKQGAVFDKATGPLHWAYLRPVKPVLPPNAGHWARNPIDLFVQKKLNQEGLTPQIQANKEMLIRRVSLDLIGLPPTPEEVQAFLDDHSDHAYSKVVDRLLSSPHFGERQARIWLDLARYADSDGYEKDLNREAWEYRDWVIQAFNQNLPFDQFTIDQIAGDLLPSPSRADRIATGFHRNTMLNQEGGVNAEQAHFALIEDRAETTSSVWLGSTLACAKCHDHKYDPFTQKDYYAMVAFFNRSKVKRDVVWTEPILACPTPRDEVRLRNLEAKLKQAQHDMTIDATGGFESWRMAARLGAQIHPLPALVAGSAQGQTLSIRPQSVIFASGVNPKSDVYTVELAASDLPTSGLKLDVLADDALPNRGPGRAANGNFEINRVEVLIAGKPVRLIDAQADFSQIGFPAASVLNPDGKAGWGVDGATGKDHSLVLTFGDAVPPGQKITLRMSFEPYDYHNLGKFRVSALVGLDPALALAPQIVKLAGKGSLTKVERGILSDYFLAHSRWLAQHRARIAEFKLALAKLNANIPKAMVMQDVGGQDPLKEAVRSRGEFQTKLAKVSSAPPKVLITKFPSGSNRLALARWLVDRSNPLTARVEVNRLWEQYFGRGIVETSEDFGTRCTPPSHPELLDWLATTFEERDWDLKAMHRIIVTSATYMQDSRATPADMKSDPDNRLLSRGPRFRMEAEMIHDNALAISGLLSSKIGGPSVYPFQPEGTWNTPANTEQWITSKGQNRYRRGIYTFWKRTSPYPSFLTFDATSRENCTIRRTRTNTPLQALALLNDQLMMEAAKALAAQMQRTPGGPKTKLESGLVRCLARKPSVKELAILENLLHQMRVNFEAKPAEAAKFGGVEQAAYTMVANVLLNLDETVTKE